MNKLGLEKSESCVSHHYACECREAEYLNQIKKRDYEIKRLRDALNDAADFVEQWGSYASPYFQGKWNLAGDVQRIRDAAKGVVK